MLTDRYKWLAMSKQSAQDLLAGLDALPDDGTIPTSSTTNADKAGKDKAKASGGGNVDDEASINEFLAEFGKERERPSRPMTPSLAGGGAARAKAGSRNSSLNPRVVSGSVGRRSRAPAGQDDGGSARGSMDSVRSKVSFQERDNSNMASSFTAEDAAVSQSGSPAPDKSSASAAQPSTERNTTDGASAGGGGGGWGSWSSSLWSTATSLQATIKSEAERRLQELQQSEEAKKLQARLRELDLAKLASEARSIGQRAIEAVAPPISRSEVLRVHVAHDLRGVRVEESLGRAFERAMEQVEGGRWRIFAKDMSSADGAIDLDAGSAPGSYAEALKMCRAAVEATLRDDPFLNKADKPDEDSAEGNSKVGESVIYVSIQAFTYQPVVHAEEEADKEKSDGDDNELELHLLLHLSDPANKITMQTSSQGIPPAWLALSGKNVPETAYQPREWVADWCEDILTTVAGVLAQKYVCRRMGLDRWLEAEAGNAGDADDKPTVTVEKSDVQA